MRLRGVRGVVVVVAITAAAGAFEIGSPPAEAQQGGGIPDGLVWLGLGDSYSSGEGLAYNDQQANPPGQTCERATGETSVNDGNGSRAFAKVAYDERRDRRAQRLVERDANARARAPDV